MSKGGAILRRDWSTLTALVIPLPTNGGHVWPLLRLGSNIDSPVKIEDETEAVTM